MVEEGNASYDVVRAMFQSHGAAAASVLNDLYEGRPVPYTSDPQRRAVLDILANQGIVVLNPNREYTSKNSADIDAVLAIALAEGWIKPKKKSVMHAK